MKKMVFLLACLLPLGLFAQSFQEGVSISPFSVKDQFEKELKVDASTKEIIIAFAQEQGNVMKAFLEANPNYLSQNSAVYLMDASKVPSMVLSMFMLPKFKKYPYTIGLVEDEKEVASFPFKEGKLTVIHLENLTIKTITFKDKW